MYGIYKLCSAYAKIFIHALLATLICTLGAPKLRADFKDDIDFTKLKAEYGESLPTGSGVRIAQVEYMRYGFWAPLADGELAGKTFTYVTDRFGGYSSHANEVAAYLGGRTTSITSGLPGWYCFEATNYCGDQSLLRGHALQPLVATWDIENHSWGGNDMIDGITNLQRMDLRIERDNVIVVVGIDNGSTTPMSNMMANAYNVISVGSSTGDHPHSGSTLEVLGRIKPELVGTATWTSYATPIVASCATLLLGEINRTPAFTAARSSMVIKALLMAGATKTEFPNWQHTPARPLDAIYGAGEVNIYNSYKALVAGRQQPLAATPLSVSGWDANTTSQTARRLYYFSIPSGQTLSLSAVLAWNRHVLPDLAWLNPVSIVQNLDLVLWRADSSYNLQSKVAESISSIDNVEHIYELVGAGVYALEVVAPIDGEKYGLAWSGALSGGSSTTPVVPVAPSVTNGFVDASFESVPVGSNCFSAFAYNPSGTAWTFGGYAGVSGNNSGFTSGNPSAPDGGQVGFIQMTGSITQTVALAAGTYTVTAQAAQRATYQCQSQTVDVSVDGVNVGSFSAPGTGFVAVTTGSFSVGAGTHVIRFSGRASVDSTLFIDKLNVTAAVSATAPSLPTVANGGFEAPAVGSNYFYAFAYNPSGTAWTFSARSGVAGNGSGFTSGNSGAPEGGQVGFIQMTGSIEQNISLSAGSYIVSAQVAQRCTYQQQSQTVDVYVDGQQVGTFAPPGIAYTTASTSAFTVSGGEHTLKFVGRATLDGTLFIDGISIQSGNSGVPQTPASQTVSVSVPENGFEAPDMGANAFAAFAYNPAGSVWTFTGAAGLSGNRSGFTDNNANAPEGGQVAFLQESTSAISQTLSFPTSGTYTLIVSAARRGGPWNVRTQVVQVYLDNDLAGTFTPDDTNYQTFTLNFGVSAGTHRLSFKGSVHADATAFIDDVVIIGP